ncbi:MAG: hypothetical protein R2697_07700 [Ilumatobacteraceae bacterium]
MRAVLARRRRARHRRAAALLTWHWRSTIRPRRPCGRRRRSARRSFAYEDAYVRAARSVRCHEKGSTMTLANHPPHDRWHDWRELDAKA